MVCKHKDPANHRVSGAPLSWASEPESRIVLFVWARSSNTVNAHEPQSRKI